MKDILDTHDALKKQYPLQQWANLPVLRTVCTPVKNITKEIRTFARDLLELMRAYDGVGLAAPQLGKAWRIVAFTQRDTSKKERELIREDVMINPVLLAVSTEMEKDKEWCLSLPGIEWEVRRPSSITVKYLTPAGKEVILKAKGYNARIIQHELDHLDGILFIDKLEK